MTDKAIKEFYEGIVLVMGAPTSIVPTLILISKHMDSDNKLTLFSELRQLFMDVLNVGKSRMSQILKILENSDIIRQSEDIKIVYHINKFVPPYEKLINSRELKFICIKKEQSTEIQIIE